VFTKIKKKTKPLSHFIWLFLLIIITSLVTYFYEQNKKSNYKNLKKTLNIIMKNVINDKMPKSWDL